MSLLGATKPVIKPDVELPLINQVVIEPLALFEETKIYASVNSSITNPITLVIGIQNNTGQHIIINKIFENTKTEIFTYDNRYTVDSGNSITVMASSRTKTESYGSKTISVKQRDIISLNEDKTYTSTSRALVYQLSQAPKYENETITFAGFDEFYIPDYYHKFDPSIFTFAVSSPSKAFFGLESATFIISNRNGVFNSLLSNTNYAQLDLIMVKDTASKFHLEFKDKLFVNPKTLEMSSYKKTGYVETKYLFLPINEMRYQNEYECGISITGLGLQKSKFIHYFALKAMLNTMGDCHNSEYCIVNK